MNNKVKLKLNWGITPTGTLILRDGTTEIFRKEGCQNKTDEEIREIIETFLGKQEIGGHNVEWVVDENGFLTVSFRGVTLFKVGNCENLTQDEIVELINTFMATPDSKQIC